MEPRMNVITLGVKDVKKSRDFYENGLGWKASSSSNEHIVIFPLKGIVFCLYPETLLAEDATVDASRHGFRGVTMSQNVASQQEVAQVLEKAARAGAAIVKQAQDVFWGGHSGYFSDPDGHLWEVVWNPHWPLQEDGSLKIP